MLRGVGTFALPVVLVLAVAACSEAGSATPTTSQAELTTLPPAPAASSTTTADSASVTTTTASAVSGLPEYAVVARIENPQGDTLVVLLDPDSYDTLTDIDLENVVADVYEQFPPVWELHVIDSEAAAELVVDTDVDPESLPILDEHYLVRLEEGFRIVYLGPYSSIPDSILGS